MKTKNLLPETDFNMDFHIEPMDGRYAMHEVKTSINTLLHMNYLDDEPLIMMLKTISNELERRLK